MCVDVNGNFGFAVVLRGAGTADGLTFKLTRYSAGGGNTVPNGFDSLQVFRGRTAAATQLSRIPVSWFTSARIRIKLSGSNGALDIDMDFDGTPEQTATFTGLPQTGGNAVGLGVYAQTRLDDLKLVPLPDPPPDGSPAPTPPTPTADAPTPTCAKRSATIVGTPGDDALKGTPGPDVIVGLGGDDAIKGLRGDDVICGNSGNDKLFGGPGDDVIRGGKGKDKVVGGPGKDTLNPGRGGRGPKDVVAQ